MENTLRNLGFLINSTRTSEKIIKTSFDMQEIMKMLSSFYLESNEILINNENSFIGFIWREKEDFYLSFLSADQRP